MHYVSKYSRMMQVNRSKVPIVSSQKFPKANFFLHYYKFRIFVNWKFLEEVATMPFLTKKKETPSPALLHETPHPLYLPTLPSSLSTEEEEEEKI